MKFYKLGIHETMGGPRVDECGKSGSEVGDEGRYTEGIWIGKSGRVETDYLGFSTRRFNAVLSKCGGWRTA